jgi:hypothetical protein
MTEINAGDATGSACTHSNAPNSDASLTAFSLYKNPLSYATRFPSTWRNAFPAHAVVGDK